MNSLTIYHGAAVPVRVRGVHVCRLVDFAQRFPGWHTAAKDRTTQRALDAATRAGCIERAQDQFRFTYPRST